MPKWTLVILALFPALTSSAKTDHSHINSGSELRDWCEQRSDRYFNSKKLKHYNWSASTINKNNYFETSGEWRVEGKRMKVFCRARKGSTKRQASFHIVAD